MAQIAKYRADTVSIHAPRAGCDVAMSKTVEILRRFNSRTPCGVRLIERSWEVWEQAVSIHAPRAGCDTYPRYKS